MSIDDQIKFLILLRSKLNKVATKISVKEPVIECVAMLTSRIEELQKEKERDGG